MKLNEFKEKYSSLNHNHKHIVFHTLRRMQQSKKHTRINHAIHNKILQKRKSMNIGYEELYRLLSKSLNNTVNRKTYEAFMRRKSIESELLIETCKILNISIEDINKLKNSFIIQGSVTREIDWLYNSLTKQDQSAICYLASALYMDEHYPEIFNDNDDDK